MIPKGSKCTRRQQQQQLKAIPSHGTLPFEQDNRSLRWQISTNNVLIYVNFAWLRGDRVKQAMDSIRNEGAGTWRRAAASDLVDIQEIGGQIHPDLHERPEVFCRNRLRAISGGLLLLLCETNGWSGYGLSHPWLLNSIPPLNQLLGSIPPSPECLLIHDVAVLPHARGHGAAGILIGLATKLARKQPAYSMPCAGFGLWHAATLGAPWV